MERPDRLLNMLAVGGMALLWSACRPLPDRMRAVLADARDQTQADDADQILDPTGRKPLFGSPLVDLEDSYASLVEMLWLLDHDEPFAYLW